MEQKGKLRNGSTHMWSFDYCSTVGKGKRKGKGSGNKNRKGNGNENGKGKGKNGLTKSCWVKWIAI